MDRKYRWPKKGDNPFYVKSANPNLPTWASLGWFESVNMDDSPLSFAFKECADKSIDGLKKGTSPRHSDMIFLPIAYLYRHSLELKMKQIIRLALKINLIENNGKISKLLDSGHELYPLWNYVKKCVVSFWPEAPDNDLTTVERIVQILHNIDKSGQELRYTKNSKGQSSLSNLPNSVDLIHFKDVFEGVFNLLDGCEFAFEDTFNNMHEITRNCKSEVI